MLRVAQTKGAISNKERMALLGSCTKQLQDKASGRGSNNANRPCKMYVAAFATGEQASNPASATQVDQLTQQSGGVQLTDDDQTFLNKYQQEQAYGYDGPADDRTAGS